MEILSLGLQVVVLIGLSAICSGLNVAFLSLDPGDLKRKASLGDKDAKRVLPLRRNSYLTLVSILLTNVAVISATSLVLGTRLNGVVAGILSTLLIVLFGEILPQALFSRHALSFCARFSPLLKAMIFITYPLSKPLQLLLDKLFGYQAVNLHNRRELGMMLKEHVHHKNSDLDEDEVEIMRGALGLSEKRVRDITTPITRVYWLTPDSMIDAVRIDEIKAQAWSRIPIFDKELTTCYGILMMKDMVDMDFDEEPVRADALPLHPSNLVGSMTALDTLFRKFINARSHMMPVERDDRIIGIVTIEDLIEEILGREIEDEADHMTRH